MSIVTVLLKQIIQANLLNEFVQSKKLPRLSHLRTDQCCTEFCTAVSARTKRLDPRNHSISVKENETKEIQIDRYMDGARGSFLKGEQVSRYIFTDFPTNTIRQTI